MRFVRLQFTAIACAALICFSGCGGASTGSNKSGSGSGGSGGSPTNTVAISVNAGPTGNYANGLFATVTVCASGTSNCQAINDVLVDTGSFGLRILSSALNSSLSNALSNETANGNTIVECAQFSDGITWGPVAIADVKIGGEAASAIPVQVIGSPSFPSVPSGCSSAGSPEDTQGSLGTNGILGIGNFVQDCPACAPGTTKNGNFYYACSGPSSCSVTTVSLADQVQNPVAAFSTDNNGVVIELPAATSSTTSLSGSMIFGIGTQSNNALGSAKVYTINTNTGNFSTTFNSHTYSDSSFLDTGSNAYFFLDSAEAGLPTCPSPANGFYCPSSPANLTATNTGANNASASIPFTVDNAETLFSNVNAAVFPTLGGPLSGLFDWGLPFFYGRNVYVAIAGASTPGGTGPYWAY